MPLIPCPACTFSPLVEEEERETPSEEEEREEERLHPADHSDMPLFRTSPKSPQELVKGLRDALGLLDSRKAEKGAEEAAKLLGQIKVGRGRKERRRKQVRRKKGGRNVRREV